MRLPVVGVTLCPASTNRIYHSDKYLPRLARGDSRGALQNQRQQMILRVAILQYGDDNVLCSAVRVQYAYPCRYGFQRNWKPHTRNDQWRKMLASRFIRFRLDGDAEVMDKLAY